MGVVSMRERVRALGGTFRLHSLPGLGTRIEADLPARLANGSASDPAKDTR
jgi:signal transduction histidine kinase